MNSRHKPAVSILAIGLLAIAGCAAGPEIGSGATDVPAPTPSETAEPTVSEIADWDFLVDISVSGMEFSGDYAGDMRRYDEDYEEETVGDTWADRICNTSMNNGPESAYHFGARTDHFFFSDFYDETAHLTGASWDAARTVAYYNCPSRFGIVDSVENFITKN